MAYPIAGRGDPRHLPPRTAPGNVGIGAPTFPATRRPPSSTTPAAPSDSRRPETSAFSGPVATSPGSSIRLHPEAQNRTTRVLPNPDNSCANDTSRKSGCEIASNDIYHEVSIAVGLKMSETGTAKL